MEATASKSTRILGIVGIVLLVAGLIGWVMQMSGGLLTGSSMTNIFLWGLMIAMFAFMVGFGAGAQITASIIYLTGKEELLPWARMGAAVGLACVGGAGVAILADLGAARNILYMIVGLNIHSPLAWDMIAMTAFLVLSVIQLVMMARGSASVKVWVILAGIGAVVLQVVEGLLFSLQSSHAWWSTPIMPVDFLAVAVVSGSALLLLIACVKGAGEGSLRWLARLCAIAVAVHLVLALADLGLVAAETSAVSVGVMDVIVAYLPLYLCELVLPAAGMIVLFATAKSAKVAPKLVGSLLVIVGIFAHRLMLLYPAYDAPSLYLTLSGTDAITGPYPISTGRYLDWDTTFALATGYVPTPLEWVAALLPIGVAIVATLVILWAMKKIAAAGTKAA